MQRRNFIASAIAMVFGARANKPDIKRREVVWSDDVQLFDIALTREEEAIMYRLSQPRVKVDGANQK